MRVCCCYIVHKSIHKLTGMFYIDRRPQSLKQPDGFIKYNTTEYDNYKRGNRDGALATHCDMI